MKIDELILIAFISIVMKNTTKYIEINPILKALCFFIKSDLR